jgi:biopolymer transport protein ExbB
LEKENGMSQGMQISPSMTPACDSAKASRMAGLWWPIITALAGLLVTAALGHSAPAQDVKPPYRVQSPSGSPSATLPGPTNSAPGANSSSPAAADSATVPNAAEAGAKAISNAGFNSNAAPPQAPGTTPGQTEEAQPSIGRAQLPRDLSPWGMFLNADIVVKAVIIGLALASLVTWTIFVAKSFELRRARRQVRQGLRVLVEAGTLAQAREQLRNGKTAVAQLMEATRHEIRLSANARGDGLKERIAWQLERLELASSRRISRGTGVLATIGSTAPFVGLFGTVWGIMNSFIGISNAHTTNLAVVAPGIAEALLATALGLIAAIPAVMIYNVLARSTANYRALLGDASAQVMRLVSRDLDRAKLPLSHAAE